MKCAFGYSGLSRFLRLMSLGGLLVFATMAHAEEQITIPRADGAQTPLMVYEPAKSSGCPPLAVFSHGVGGSNKDLGYLASALADDGWLAVVMQHNETGRQVARSSVMSEGLRKGLLDLTASPPAYKARFMDLSATLKWADARCHAPFKAMLGHSMGAATVMLEAGAHNRMGVEGANRFDAYVALSPQGPGSIFPDHAWHDLRKPVLVVTGTKDNGTEGEWRWRTTPYTDMSPGGCKQLAVFDGANHLNFAGIGMFAGGIKSQTVKTVLNFLDGLRNGKCAAPPAASGLTMNVK